MKHMLIAGLFLLCIPVLAACSSAGVKETSAAKKETMSMSGSQTSNEEAYHKITSEEAKKMIDEGNVTVVDVRTASEYADGHIPDALLVPNETIADEALEKLPDKDAVLLVHCRTGVRSKQASDKLVELGYTHIYDFGGIADWPYETEEGEFME